MKSLYLLLFFTVSSICFGQNPVSYTPGIDRLANEKIKDSLSNLSIFNNYPIENIGPTVFSGRIVDVDVNPADPSEFYAAYASGGLWYTKNNGTTFEPIFDNNEVVTIGDIAVDWELGHIWVATGEVNSSRSSYAGLGIYKSEDKGESWIYKGLPESHHIGRLLIDKNDKNTVYVAVLGHLYSPNPERGVYKTTDNGFTWERKLFVDENTGAVDLIQDEDNPSILYAAMWQRDRKAWNFQESGKSSGIYKSIDFGNKWELITDLNSGFPQGDGVGRIGISLSKKDGNSFLFAFLDNYDRRPKEKTDGKPSELKKEDFKEMTKADFLKLEVEKLTKYLEDNDFPESYSAEKVIEMVKADKVKPIDLAVYLEDANSLLFDTPVIGAEIYLLDEKSKTWNKTHEGYFDGLVYSYGYYFGQIRSEAKNPNKLYVMGVPILKSDDMGKTWSSINGDNVHVDHHALWLNPNKSGHLINGNDGGINISYDDGENWIKCNMPAVGQFYYINVDNKKPYNVYGGTQDNGVWKGNNNYNAGVRWQMNGDYPYDMIMGGDGMQIQIDNRDNETVYTGYQFGNYFRKDPSGKGKYITPKHKLGDAPYRWNWQTPILLSPHNQDILYMGANKLLRSMDKGETFTEISKDLTNGGEKGDVAFGTLTSIDESISKFGLIYTGSDDGKVFRTENGGFSWTDIGQGLPKNMWVSRIVASVHHDSTVYVTLNGYRWDNWESMIYKSTNLGNTWSKIGLDIPNEPINVVKEDPNNKFLLFVGTDHGLYLSTNQGENFTPFSKELPNVPVHDVVIQKREGDLLIGTHGRSIYKSDLNPLYNLLEEKEKLFVTGIDKIWYSSNWGVKNNIYSEVRKPSIKTIIYSEKSGLATYQFLSKEEKVLDEQNIELTQGFKSYDFDIEIDEKRLKSYKKEYFEEGKPEKSDNGVYYPIKGSYKVKLTLNDISKIYNLEIE